MPATTLKKWGNSTGILIPKAVLGNMGWKLGDELNFSTKGSKLELQKKAKARTSRKSIDLEQLFQGWDSDYELPGDLRTSGNEVNWGKPVGDEM